jgi:hypothetical protein
MSMENSRGRILDIVDHELNIVSTHSECSADGIIEASELSAGMTDILRAMEVMLLHIECLEVHLEQTRQTIRLGIVNGPDVDLLLGSFAVVRDISATENDG